MFRVAVRPCLYNVFGRHATQEKKEGKKELPCDQRYYLYMCVCIMSLVAMQLLFPSFFVELRP